MTKKHYVEMAKAFNKAFEECGTRASCEIVTELAEAFATVAKKANAAFSKDKFWDYLGFN